jgi:hypothetical protein
MLIRDDITWIFLVGDNVFLKIFHTKVVFQLGKKKRNSILDILDHLRF